MAVDTTRTETTNFEPESLSAWRTRSTASFRLYFFRPAIFCSQLDPFFCWFSQIQKHLLSLQTSCMLNTNRWADHQWWPLYPLPLSSCSSSDQPLLICFVYTFLLIFKAPKQKNFQWKHHPSWKRIGGYSSYLYIGTISGGLWRIRDRNKEKCLHLHFSLVQKIMHRSTQNYKFRKAGTILIYFKIKQIGP